MPLPFHVDEVMPGDDLAEVILSCLSSCFEISYLYYPLLLTALYN